MPNTDQPSDDSLAYARSLERAEASNHKKSDDPLGAVKDMRLQQLAACRIKTEEELRAKRLKTKVDSPTR